MGSCNFKPESLDPTVRATQVSIGRGCFHFHYVIGRGGFGRVWRVELNRTHTLFAMKEMSKARVLSKKSVNSVLNERKLLGSLKHEFIVNMQYAFQDKDNLYLVMDLLTGGDLRYHLGKLRRFSEEQTRFFVACVVLGLEFLHKNGIIHRDIKPENLVMDAGGYVRITDFGIARVWTPDNSKDTSGTPGYMAPEVMCRQNHGVAVDYFALGVLCYEFMTGRRPYQGKTRKDIRDLVLAHQVQLSRSDIPPNWSPESGDFINKLIQRKPCNRLGVNGPQEVKTHPWLQSFPWEKLQAKELQAPFRPSSTEDNFDARHHFNDPWKDADSEAMRQGLTMLRQLETQNLFAGYFYDVEQVQSVCSSVSTV